MNVVLCLTRGRPRSNRTGFTLVELLVVIVLVGFLALMFLPAHAASRTKSQSIRCLDNLRQIMGALMMYTHDNHDFFPPNALDTQLTGYNWCLGNAGVGQSSE